jgi:gamma-glutamyl hercynylcysteine S-oxide synthase
MFARLRQLLPGWHKTTPHLDSHKELPSDSAYESTVEETIEDVTFMPECAAAEDVESLVNQMLAHHRYGLLLRPQIAQNLTPELYQAAKEALNTAMGLVPTGNVYLEPSVFDVDYAAFVSENPDKPREFTVHVQSVYLDRHLVTNHQFQQFVNAGGYQEMAIWDEEVLPAVLDFTDQTGQPGPKFWRNGRYRNGERNLPVVGVSWYEAVAYARWVGKRLSTEAEWVKAGSWPVTLSATTHLQRKYPWGDTFDRRKANIWGSAPERIVAVEEFTEGVSVGGLYQLIGNVWEWTANTLETETIEEEADRGRGLLLKTIRGGAYDTYFEHQANCQFASGENPISRKHNIGFRCALSLSDVAGAPNETQQDVAPNDENAEINLNEQSLIQSAEQVEETGT